MYVVKRNGKQQEVFFDKITNRINHLKLKEPVLLHVNAALIAQKVIIGLYEGITTSELDNIAGEIAISLTTTHPDYGTLASRIIISNLHKATSSNYEEVCDQLYNHINTKTNEHAPLLSTECYQIIKNNIEILQQAIDYSYDYSYDYFGFKTLAKSYLFKINKNIVERPQHMLMRVAVGIHKTDINSVIESYQLMAKKHFTHASPTLFNAATPTPQLASCFLLTMKDDSIEGIYETLKKTALISKHAGGIGLAVHNIRAKNSYIKSSNGEAGGLVPMLHMFDKCAKHVNQSSIRKGAFAIYVEPHHPDIESFLELKKNNGSEELRCRELFYALWISDLFMNRVQNNEKWSLFCPNECPGLENVYGEEYEKLYLKYEQQGKAKKTIMAQALWFQIINSHIETGTPYMLYKDTINKHSNQSNLGTIKSSNLCVSGDTYILTDKGQIHIKDLVNQQVNIWNGEEWSMVKMVQTGQDQELLKVTLSNGVEIKCTPYHKFPIVINNELQMIEAQNLQPLNTLLQYKLPIINNDNDYDTTTIYKDKEQAIDKRLTLQLSGIDTSIVKHNNEYKLCITNDHITVLSIEPLIQKEDTYCFNEPKKHMGMFSGVLLGQCAEIVEYTAPEEYAVCTLASIGLPTYVINGQFDHQLLYKVCYHVTGNLNKVIDNNYYPVIETQVSNLKHRPIGIGLQGMADVFLQLKLPFDSPEAKQLNVEILETMYYAACRASCDLAKKDGPYSTFANSPASKGILCPDMWNHTPTTRWDFKQLRADVVKYGLRNSLLIALMPTASTASILNNTEAAEPIMSNIYSRRVLAGEFVIVNKYLVKDLLELGLWDERMKNEIISKNGSVQGIQRIPQKIQYLYRTVWELKMKDLIDMSAARRVFVDQSESFNCFMETPNKAKLTSMHFYAWSSGLKTGQYYLRTRPAVNAIQFTVDRAMLNEKEEKKEDKKEDKKENKEEVCNMEEGCLLCGA
jgi:ribonucleotide reductase alpha subunit